MQAIITWRNSSKGKRNNKNQPDLNFKKIDLTEWTELDSLGDQVDSLNYSVLNVGITAKKKQTKKPKHLKNRRRNTYRSFVCWYYISNRKL